MDSRNDPYTRADDGPADTRRHLRVQPVEVLPDGAARRMGTGWRQDPLDRVKVPGHRPVDPGRPGIRLRPRRSVRYPGSHTHARTGPGISACRAGSRTPRRQRTLGPALSIFLMITGDPRPCRAAGTNRPGRLPPRGNRGHCQAAREQPMAWRTIPARGGPRRAGMRTNAVLASQTGRPNSPFASRREMQ